MKLSLEAERSVIESARRYPSDHIVWQRKSYSRADGALTVYRDGLSEALHRRLYRLVIDPELKRQRLERTCDRWGCANPYHYRIAGGTERGARTHCGKGHPYEPDNVTDSGHCLICATARRAKRAAGEKLDAPARNAAKEFCPSGHAYDQANTYIAIGARGIHRKCRRCNRDRARRTREAKRELTSAA